MGNIARHHHYIPQGYLRGFAQRRSERQWYTYVIDFSAQRTFLSSTRGVCGERDFLRIESAKYPADVLEKEMAKFEAQCIDAIRRIAVSGIFEGNDANLVLNLMALLAVRSPEMRENLRGSYEQLAKCIMDITLVTKDRWEEQTRRMRKDGVPVSDISYEDIKAFHEGQKYKVTLAREFQIGIEFKMIESVLDALGKRLWTVYTTDGSTGEFLTTNRPVTLSYIEPEKVPVLYRRSPGFGLLDTEVYFPLTRNALLVGRFDRGGGLQVANQPFIAAVNMHMISQCYGKAFSRRSEILYFDPRNQTIYQDEMLLERVQAWRGQNTDT